MCNKSIDIKTFVKYMYVFVYMYVYICKEKAKLVN